MWSKLTISPQAFHGCESSLCSYIPKRQCLIRGANLSSMFIVTKVQTLPRPILHEVEVLVRMLIPPRKLSR